MCQVLCSVFSTGFLLNAQNNSTIIVILLSHLINLKVWHLNRCNSPFTSMDKSSRQKINKETIALNDTLDQKDLIHTEHFIHKQQNTYSPLVHIDIL